MPRTAKDYVPRYGLHRASGQARVEIDGRTFYLGPYKTKASYLQYDRLITEWLAGGRRLETPEDEDVTVNEVIASFWTWAKSYYGDTGKRKGTANRHKPILSMLRQYYGETPAVEFGPKRLEAIKYKLIEKGYAQKSINDENDTGWKPARLCWATPTQTSPRYTLNATCSGQRKSCER